MVLPSKPPAKRTKGNQLFLLAIIASLLILVASQLSFSSDSYPSPTTGSQVLRNSNDNNARVWKGLSVDKNPSTLGSVVPTGTYLYKDSRACQPATSNCKIHFPITDLSNQIKTDELLLPSQDVPFEFPPPPTLLVNLTAPTQEFALVTRRGHKGADQASKNQDRIFLFQEEGSKVVALFDGHGFQGHVISHSAVLMLPKLLSVGGNRMQESLLEAAILSLDTSLPQAAGAGSTAIVMVKQEKKNALWVANVGDSVGIVAEYDPVDDSSKIIYRTSPHKPHLPEERARIEAKGGVVLEPQMMGDSSRVIIPTGGMEMALAMSRTLGDVEGKRLGYLTAQPKIDRIPLDTSKKQFVIAATDGLVDFAPVEGMVEYLGQVLYGSRSNSVRLMDACEQLIMMASLKWKENTQSTYRDDISLLVTKV